MTAKVEEIPSTPQQMQGLSEAVAAAIKAAQPHGVIAVALVAVLPDGGLAVGLATYPGAPRETEAYATLVLHGHEALKVHADSHIRSALVRARGEQEREIAAALRRGAAGHA